MKQVKSKKEEGLRAFLASLEEDYRHILPALHRPSGHEWGRTLWRVSLILLVLGLLIMGADYLLAEGVMAFQGLLAPLPLGPGVTAAYLVFMVVLGLLTAGGILLQQGTTDGLTSLFGSSSGFGGGSASFGKHVAYFTHATGGLFLLAILASPALLGGAS